MPLCHHCQSQINPDAFFCSQCGQPLHLPCPNCGAGVEKSHTECNSCGFNLKEGTSKEYEQEDRKNAKDILSLIYHPVSLIEFKKTFPYLNRNELDPEYVRAVDTAKRMAKSKDIVQILTSYPRQWAILKVGLLRRLLTLFIDWPILMVFFLAGLVLFIGSATEPGLLHLKGGSKAAFVWIWFFISYFIYFAGTEYTIGSTIGGLIMGVRVVDRFGKKQTLKALLYRNTYKLIPLIGPFALGPYVKPDHEIVKS